MLGLPLVVALLLVAQDPSTAPPGTPPAAAQPKPDQARAVEILKAADKATLDVQAIRYDGYYRGTGALATREPIIKATVTKAFTSETASDMFILGEGWFLPGNVKTWSPVKYIAAYNGQTIRRIDHDGRRVIEAPIESGNAGAVLGPIINVDMREYGHSTPFQDELDAIVQSHEGQAFVGEVLCDVVYVEYGDAGRGQRARWYFGAEDHLPRQVERIINVQATGRDGARVLTLTNVVLNPDMKASDFNLPTPDGYAVEPPSAPRPTTSAGGGTGS
jgi:hypothetical protein